MIDFDPTDPTDPLLRSVIFTQALKHCANLPEPTQEDLDFTMRKLLDLSRIWFNGAKVNQPALDKILAHGSPLPLKRPFVFMSDDDFAAMIESYSK